MIQCPSRTESSLLCRSEPLCERFFLLLFPSLLVDFSFSVFFSISFFSSSLSFSRSGSQIDRTLTQWTTSTWGFQAAVSFKAVICRHSRCCTHISSTQAGNTSEIGNMHHRKKLVKLLVSHGTAAFSILARYICILASFLSYQRLGPSSFCP